MTDIKPVAWMTDDGRVVLTKTQEGMPSAAKISYNLPLYPESALLQAREEGRRKWMLEAAQIVLNGRFLHDKAPTKLFANEAAAAITRAAEGNK